MPPGSKDSSEVIATFPPGASRNTSFWSVRKVIINGLVLAEINKYLKIYKIFVVYDLLQTETEAVTAVGPAA